MDKNIRIARQLVKIAKRLVASDEPSHDVNVDYCCMSPVFDRMTFDTDYERVYDGYMDEGIYLYGGLKGKKPVDVFDMSGFNEEWVDYYGENWNAFFSETGDNMNNVIYYGNPLKQGYDYVIPVGNSQSDFVQVIYDKSEVQNAKEFFQEFFYDYTLSISLTIDGEEYDDYDIMDDLSDYSKEKVIESLKIKLGDKFDDDIRSQLEEQLPGDNEIEYTNE